MGGRFGVGDERPQRGPCQPGCGAAQEWHDHEPSNGGNETTQRKSREDIAGIVGADVHTGERHQDREGGGDDAPSPVGEQQPDRHGAGNGRVVAGEREVGGLVNEQVDVGHRLVWSGSIDCASDDLPDTERDQCGGRCPYACGDGGEVGVLTSVDVGDQQQHGEQHDAVSGVRFEEAVCPAGPVGKSVDPAEDAAIHQ